MQIPIRTLNSRSLHNVEQCILNCSFSGEFKRVEFSLV